MDVLGLHGEQVNDNTLTPKAIAYLDAQKVQRPRNDAGKEEMR